MTEPCERYKRTQDIAHKHFDRCLWQMLSDNRMIVVEHWGFSRAKTTVIVVKHFQKPIPKNGGKGSWPKLEASFFYVPVDDVDNTFDSLESVLRSMYQA
jgi:hypothetical protein